MPSTEFPSDLGIDAAALSERARALLSHSAATREPEATVPGNEQILLWILLVMRATRLQRFADHVGMLGAGASLRLVLDGRRIAAFREQLSPELYRFGMLRAPLIGTLSMTSGDFDDPFRVGAAVQEAGMAALHAFCNDPGGAHLHLRARLSARLEGVASRPSVPIFSAPPSSALLQRVLREVEPVLACAFEGVRDSP